MPDPSPIKEESKNTKSLVRSPFLLICIGVSGCGKSTLAAKLARHYDAEFMEADDFHSEENKTHMASGKPLSDAMRLPWINSMCNHLSEKSLESKNCVLAYSGLRREHRDRFRTLNFKVIFLFLDGSKTLINKRLRSRKGHFMPAVLINSQFAALQSPEGEPDVIKIAINQPVSRILQTAKLNVDERLDKPDSNT